MRTLVMGFGVRGRQWGAAVRRHPRMSLVGVCDPDPAAAEAAARARSPLAGGLDEALERFAPDAAILAVPPWIHLDAARTCLAAGLPVLVEKPLAPSLRESALVAEAAEGAGLPALVGQNFRYHPRERAVRAALPRVGRIRWGSVAQMTLPIPDPMPEGTPFPRLWALGVHHLDALRSRFPTPPRVVRPLDAAPADEANEEVSVALEWEDGTRIVYRLRERGPVFSYVEMLECEAGGIVVQGQRATVVGTGSRPRRVSVRRRPAPERFLLDRLLAAAAGGSADGLEARDNLPTIAIIEAATRALLEGRPVPLEEVTTDAGVAL